jgi:hypothetical protein
MTASPNFASLLEDLIRRDLDEAASAPGPVSFDYLAVADELCSGRIKVAPEAVVDEYRAASAALEAELDALAAASALPLPSIEPADIERELALQTAKGIDELARLRRTFAFGNHPDRVPVHLRERAMIRMQVANQLIDEARRKLVGRSRT